MQVEHEVDQRPLQARAVADEEREAAAGHLRSALEVEQTERLGDLPVRQPREALVRGHFAPAANERAVALAALRHGGVGNVGQAELLGRERGFQLGAAGIQLLDALGQRARLSNSGSDVRLRGALPLHAVDVLAGLVAPRLELLDLVQQSEVLAVQAQPEVEIAALALGDEGRAHDIRLLANELAIEHG